jgi:hypothetical protein
MSFSKIPRITLLLPCLVSFAFGAQDPESSRWLAAVQTATGKAVQVRLNDGKRIDGTLLRGRESGLVISDRRGETTVARSDVRQVRMRTGRSRGRGMLLGGIIGGATSAGLATAGTLVAAYAGAGGSDRKLLAIGLGAVATGTGIGIIIGRALTGRYQTIYEAP